MRKGKQGANVISLAVAVSEDKTKLQWDTGSRVGPVLYRQQLVRSIASRRSVIPQPRFIDSNTNKLVYRMRETRRSILRSLSRSLPQQQQAWRRVVVTVR